MINDRKNRQKKWTETSNFQKNKTFLKITKYNFLWNKISFSFLIFLIEKKAQADAIVDTILDLVNFYYANVFKVKDEEEKKVAAAAFLANQATAGAKNLETLIGLYGQKGYSVGDELTWADLLIFDVCSSMFEKVPSFMENFPVLSAVHKAVAENERIAAYVASRPQAAFWI